MAGVNDIVSGFSFRFVDDLALNVLILAIVLAVVSLFIWEFYKSTSKKNLINLNLRQYNQSGHPILKKFFAIVLYLIEYILITPILILLWFTALSFVLLLIAEKETAVSEILMIAAVIIGAVRILAYFKSEIAKDLAKLFPFFALSAYILTIGDLFDYNNLLTQLKEIPFLFSNIFSFIIVLFVIEIVLRLIYTIFDFWISEEEEDVIDRKTKEFGEEE